ncbi:MAG: hypothetical protein KF841_12090 [Phycisphaerae bacterium]|nr:hypothetical protein [Phycisphaerae bacterium]
MTSDEFQLQIARLQSKIEALPLADHEAIEKLLRETLARHAEIQAARAAALDALDDWRLTIKYAVYDAECARRERDPSSES